MQAQKFGATVEFRTDALPRAANRAQNRHPGGESRRGHRGTIMDEVTSKHIDGITDLVVIAPIKDGFIQAYENITYASRLKLVAEALNRIRVAAREYERVVPYSDVTERILNLLDFRVGVLDKDLFGLSRLAPGELALGSRRYLYLTATFEGGWEPYMRLIWKPLGPFLDLLFCNCDGYVPAFPKWRGV